VGGVTDGTAHKNTFIYLIGFPGTGKYTIGREICGTGNFRLVDNHLINNPVFSLIRLDGKTPLPDIVWEKTSAIWDVVYDVMAHISPPGESFVLTNVLLHSVAGDHARYRKVAALAETRGALFIPVRLFCDVAEAEKRIVSPERAARLKETNPAAPRRYAAEEELLAIDHPHLLDLDVTSLAPAESAAAILRHAGMRRGAQG